MYPQAEYYYLGAEWRALVHILSSPTNLDATSCARTSLVANCVTRRAASATYRHR
jgi:hypothetical protein